jgi:hypothetical protein
MKFGAMEPLEELQDTTIGTIFFTPQHKDQESSCLSILTHSMKSGDGHPTNYSAQAQRTT